MVFHCRCFSFLLEQADEDIEYENGTQTKSIQANEDIEYETGTETKSTTTSYYTAASEFNKSVPKSHAKTLDSSKLAKKQSNLRVFNLSELRSATKKFCRASKIGEGGFGSVYKGVIWSLGHPCYQIPVAVKRVNSLLMPEDEWKTKINVIGLIEHPNLVKLIGYCTEDNESGTELFLVYEYMVNRSVGDHLYAESKTHLSWSMRLNIAQDVARGVTYLLEEMDLQVTLRNFKPCDILLDAQWNAKLEDFGLAVLLPQEHNTLNPFVGTKAYAAPEYISSGDYTFKSDVWSYGVFLYELITGRRPVDRALPLKEQELLEWVKPYIESKRFPEIIDSTLEGNYLIESAQMLSNIANMCLFEDPKSRPKMSEVLIMVNQVIVVASLAIGPRKKIGNDDKKKSIGNQRRSPSFFSCFKKK